QQLRIPGDPPERSGGPPHHRQGQEVRPPALEGPPGGRGAGLETHPPDAGGGQEASGALPPALPPPLQDLQPSPGAHPEPSRELPGPQACLLEGDRALHPLMKEGTTCTPSIPRTARARTSPPGHTSVTE